jgi:transposase
MTRRDFGGLGRRRMRAVRSFEKGETQSEGARRLDVSRTTAMRLAQAWQAQGREGSRAAGRAGRMPRVTDACLG